MTCTRLAVPAFLCAAVATVSAQSGFRGPMFGRPDAVWCQEADEANACEVREATIPGLRTLVIDSRDNGGVSVLAWDRDAVRVRVRFTGYASTETEAGDLVRQARLVTDGGRIHAEGPDNPARDRRTRRSHRWWTAAFEVEVPRDAHLTIDAANGGIAVEGLRGAVTARTVNGGLIFTDVAGDVRGEAVNGGVVADLTGVRWEGAGFDVRAQNGGVRLRLPADYSADIEALAQNGGITVDVPLTIQGLTDFRREVRGRIGSGGALLRLRTQNGGVRIDRR